jgi:hypothetical protein
MVDKNPHIPLDKIEWHLTREVKTEVRHSALATEP